MEKVNLFKNQLIKVIKLLEIECKADPSDMIELILKRYKNTLSIVQVNPDSFTKKEFFIKGASRAYLEISSDYMNPI